MATAASPETLRHAPGVPVVETDRLILRESRRSDLDAMAAFYTTERSRFVGGPKSRFETWGTLTSGIGCWVLNGYGMWMVEERATGLPVGRVGVVHHDGWPEPELGWHVYDGFEGRGLAYEAALAARAAAAEYFGLDRLISLIVPENLRSRRLAERLGAVVEREGEVVGKPCLIYRHPKVKDRP